MNIGRFILAQVKNFKLLPAFGVVLIIGASSLMAASSTPIVRIDPATIDLKVGDPGTVSIRVDAVDNLYGAEVHLKFDPNVVEVIDADSSKPDIQIAPGDWLTGGFVAVNKVDNAAGQIDFAATLLNPAPPLSGSAVVATINFRAKAAGTSPLQIDQAILADRQATEIKSESQAGSIVVSGGGPAAANAHASSSGSAASGSQPAATSPLASPVNNTALIVAAAVGAMAFIAAVVVVVMVLKRKRVS